MGHKFDEIDEVEVPATPEQVWQAIATGPGIDSWFMGRNEVDEGRTVRQSYGGYEPVHPVTGWEPMRRLAYGGDEDADGRFIAYEFMIEGRDQGSTVLRLATSGFLPGDDWADEYEAMRNGGAAFFATLGAYLTHFPGRTAVPLSVFGPGVADWPAAWRGLAGALGAAGRAEAGEPVRFTVQGTEYRGEVYFRNAQTLAVRTGDGFFRFLQGLGGSMVACHNVFTPGFTQDDRDAAERAWQAWLSKALSGKEDKS